MKPTCRRLGETTPASVDALRLCLWLGNRFQSRPQHETRRTQRTHHRRQPGTRQGHRRTFPARRRRTSSFARAARRISPPRATNWPRSSRPARCSPRPATFPTKTQVNELVAFAAARTRLRSHALVLNAGIYGPMGPTESVDLDEWRRAHRHQSLRRAAAVPRGHSAFQAGRARQDHRPLRRRRDQSAAEHQLLRRLQSRRGAADGNAGGGIEAASRGRERHRARRAGDAARGRSARRRPGEGRRGVLREEQAVEGKGRDAARTRRRTGGLSRQRGERRHHRQAHQRAVGSVAQAARASRGTGEVRHLLPAAHRAGRSRQEMAIESSNPTRRHHRLRPHRPETAQQSAARQRDRGVRPESRPRQEAGRAKPRLPRHGFRRAGRQLRRTWTW